MTDAADFFLRKQQRSLGISEEEKIKIAVKSLGLDDLKPFKPEEKIIEYLLSKDEADRLIDLTAKDLADETASESMAPGGGSISAYVGALGVSLGTMVANLSAHKPGWDDRWEEFSEWAEKGQKFKERLLFLVDEDTKAFNRIIEAFRLPKGSEKEIQNRKKAIEDATKYATEIPLEVMRTAQASMRVMEAMLKNGLQSSLSDAGVGMLCARTAVTGAYFNVRINGKDLKDKAFAEDILSRAKEIYLEALETEQRAIQLIDSKM
jgi:glutamate formiminotransferase/formiminotetrahydrofolate cyclodeaminase